MDKARVWLLSFIFCLVCGRSPATMLGNAEQDAPSTGNVSDASAPAIHAVPALAAEATVPYEQFLMRSWKRVYTPGAPSFALALSKKTTGITARNRAGVATAANQWGASRA